MTPLLSIVIVNYETRGLLRQFLRNATHLQLPFPYEIVVVDNGSRDGSAAMVEREYPEVLLDALPRNCGYSAGTNRGVAVARGSYLLLVNTDVVIAAETIQALTDYLEAHERVGAVGPRLMNPDGTLQRSAYRFYRVLTPLFRRTFLGATRVGARELRRFLMLEWDGTTSRKVDWLMSSCLMVRAEAGASVAWFDTRFFVYLADTDFCRRLSLNGWEVHYLASASCVHYHRRESAESWRGSGIHAIDLVRYFWKWRGKAVSS